MNDGLTRVRVRVRESHGKEWLIKMKNVFFVVV